MLGSDKLNNLPNLIELVNDGVWILTCVYTTAYLLATMLNVFYIYYFGFCYLLIF